MSVIILEVLRSEKAKENEQVCSIISTYNSTNPNLFPLPEI